MYFKGFEKSRNAVLTGVQMWQICDSFVTVSWLLVILKLLCSQKSAVCCDAIRVYLFVSRGVAAMFCYAALA